MVTRSATRRWTADSIKVALQQKHGSITKLSTSWGYNRVAITSALRRSDYSVPLERLIAKALAAPAQELWPDRYCPKGRPLPRPIAMANANRRATSIESQKRAAA